MNIHIIKLICMENLFSFLLQLFFDQKQGFQGWFNKILKMQETYGFWFQDTRTKIFASERFIGGFWYADQLPPPVYDNSMELFWVEGGWAWEGVRDHAVSDCRYMYQTRDHIVWFINDRKLICATFDLSKGTATSVEVIRGSDWLSPEHDRKRWRIVCVKRRCSLSG